VKANRREQPVYKVVGGGGGRTSHSASVLWWQLSFKSNTSFVSYNRGLAQISLGSIVGNSRKISFRFDSTFRLLCRSTKWTLLFCTQHYCMKLRTATSFAMDLLMAISPAFDGA
jgi:hypothetical protein